MIVTIIGIGLIGGSMAISLRKSGFADKIFGIDRNTSNLNKAFELGLIDEKADFETGLAQADVIIVAIPIDATNCLVPKILDCINDQQILMDVGSTKSGVLKAVENHPQRKRFVATHPMAGTEFSGPEAAVEKLFKGKCTVFCDVEDSDEDAVAIVKELYEVLDMTIIYMNAEAHDMHAAYVSHISHISSFALALTVLEKEKEEKRIFELASGGFESSVRLAKSSPEMWTPVFMQNRGNVLDVLCEMIFQLKKMKQMLIDQDEKGFYQLIESANEIKRILR